jgi:predicted RNA binding protein YcfA (HicA-like mRNA interferase family)
MIYNDNMDNVEKIIQKFQKTDAGQKYEDCEKVLLCLGYVLKRIKGSHHQFFKNGEQHITIAKHKSVSKGAVKDVLKAWSKQYES